MYLKVLEVKNFRALEDIRVEFNPRVNVIVGPNAIGKTTILEAIRLVKALLAPRTQNEALQALISIGAVVPHNPQQMIPDALARDVASPIEIRCLYELTLNEMQFIENSIIQLATSLVRTRMGQGQNPATFAAFISAPSGKEALLNAEQEVRAGIDKINRANRSCNLDLKIDFRADRTETADPIGPAFISFLEQRHPPSIAAFSYFPADRALPSGEQPVQLGIGDAGNQLESHNSQPQTKYARLKNTIFTALVTAEDGQESIKGDFERIFKGILKGRELIGAGINHYGQLTISVQDVETQRIFDINGMSSGEKGLILTFLLIGRSLADNAVVLLDEPELHLNPAVCKDLLAFLIDGYAVPKNLQVIVCSHSPEILAGAFDREECSLYHLRSEKLLNKVRRQDQEGVNDALRLLGTSESEGLLYQSTIFVEGEQDVDLLETGFGDLLRRHKLKDLGGRHEVEKQIQLLKDAEKRGEKFTPKYFVFDRDNKPSSLESSELVKVAQWDKYCLENYLIDVDVLTSLLMSSSTAKYPLKNEFEVSEILYDLASEQLIESAAREVYQNYKYEDPGLRKSEIEGNNLEEISEQLSARLLRIKNQMGNLTEEAWKQAFIAECEQKLSELELIWRAKWRDVCDGKRLLDAVRKKVQVNMSLLDFKKIIMKEMRNSRSENWRSVKSKLEELIG